MPSQPSSATKREKLKRSSFPSSKPRKALRVNPAWLLGETDQMQLPDPATIDNLIPLPKTYQIPLLGDIACGSPILAEENVEAILEVPVHIKADFALRCTATA